MLVRLLGKLWVNPINIPLRRFAFAARRCPLRRGMLVLPKPSVQVWSSGPIDIPLRCSAFAARRGPASKGEWLLSAPYPIILSITIAP